MAEDTTGAAYRYKWDVFLSFRGEDTRNGFVADLYDELVRHGVRPFRDDEGMERGDEIAPTLLAAIEDSAAAIAVISEHYANSKWCLEEMAKIFESRKLMIPVFYKVDPSDVRWQRGKFEEDFGKHKQEVEARKVERWRNAMNRAGNISGLDTRFREESEVITILVKKVLKELNNTPLGVAKYPVGLDARLVVVLRKLDVSANDVRIIGLYGMGGIGKTTLAKALYNKLIVHFTKRSFISSIREESKKPNGLGSLQGKLLASLNSSREEDVLDTRKGMSYIKQTTRNEPVLLVLDDVDNLNQLDVLAGKRDWFHVGSRIIITSRDKKVFPNGIVNEVYEVEELTFPESVQLFSYHAFGREHPARDFMKITQEIVTLTRGLPLALEVFGSILFYERRITAWQDVCEKLKLVRPGHLQDILEISFTSLDNQEKRIFLDLACFFASMKMKREDAIDIFKGCGFNAETNITNLTAKSLVKIIDENVLWMHDQLRDMGREIVRRENDTDSGQRSRLWDQDEILKVLRNEKGTRNIEGITLDFVKKHNSTSEISHPIKSQTRRQLAFGIECLKKIYNRHIGQDEEIDDETLCTKAFKPMVNLRLLQINNANLDGSFNFLPAELKWLQWKGCPLKTLPLEFQSQYLAVLDLSSSKISQLWSSRSCGGKMGKKLIVLNLSACPDLEEIPDLSGLCLEKLILERCSALVNIHRSIGDLSKLTYLNLKECENLVEFPSDVSGLKCLEILHLSGCRKLRDLPEDMSGLKSLCELLLDRTAIVKLPESIFRLKNLELLNLNDCKSLTIIPISIGNLRSLRELSLDGSAVNEMPETIGQLKDLEKLSLRQCKSLTSLPDSIGDLKSLTELFLDFASIMRLPESMGSLCNLKRLWLSHCQNLCHLPDSICRLLSLVSLRLGSTPINKIPDQIGDLGALETLDLENCQLLRYLPESVGNLLNLSKLNLNYLMISELPKSLGSLGRLDTLQLNNCKNLQRLPASIVRAKRLTCLLMDESAVTELPADIGMLSNLRILKMRKVPNLGQANAEAVLLPASFSDLSMLERLDAYACKISGRISDDFEKLSSLHHLDLSHNSITSLPSSLRGLSLLKELRLPHCEELESLPPLPNNLYMLNVANCYALEHMPDLSNLEGLEELELTNCMKVIDIPGLENLKSLRRLYTGGCQTCLPAVKRRLSKVALRRMRFLCVPGSEIPNWFVQEVPRFSCPKNLQLKGVIIGLVVSLDQQAHDGFRNKLPAIVDIKAMIVRQNEPILTTTLNLRGVPNTDEDQLYLCRYHDYNNLVFMLEDGDMLQLTTRDPPCFKGMTLKKFGFHLVFENDDDYEDCDEALFSDESKQSVSKRLSNFFNSLRIG